MVRKIGQVEKDIAHAGIFPIQDIELLVGKEICIEQIVVTWMKRKRVGFQGLPGSLHAFDQSIKILRKGHVVASGNLRVLGNKLKNIKPAGNLRHGMDAADDLRNLSMFSG